MKEKSMHLLKVKHPNVIRCLSLISTHDLETYNGFSTWNARHLTSKVIGIEHIFAGAK